MVVVLFPEVFEDFIDLFDCQIGDAAVALVQVVQTGQVGVFVVAPRDDVVEQAGGAGCTVNCAC